MMTIEKLNTMIENGQIKEHHTASRRGYISRKSEGQVEAYKGKFGEGFILVSPRWDSTQYVYITYYTKQ